MAHVTSPHHALAGASPWQRLAALRTTLAARAAQRRRYWTTLNALEGLSDRDLADMGIHRSQIREIASQAARGA